MFSILMLLVSGCCCYLGCYNFSAILPIVIRFSWHQNVIFQRSFFLSVFGKIITPINEIVFWTIFGTVLHGTVFLNFAISFRYIMYRTV